jgi:hypothetical protein
MPTGTTTTTPPTATPLPSQRHHPPTLSHAVDRQTGAGQDLQDDGLDVLLAAKGLPGLPAVTEVSRDNHPRVTRAHAHRSGVRVFEFQGDDALLILGYGFAGRLEVACEVKDDLRNQGIASCALIESRRLVAPEHILFAQTAPGNAASLRSLLAAGFQPLASEVLFFPH